MKLRYLALLCASTFSVTTFANSTSLYVEQNIASNATDDGIYSTEAGAYIDVSDNGQVYIGFDDQGWLAAGYGYDFNISDNVDFNLYGEIGKWDTGEEILIEGIVNFDLNDNISLFTGYGYNRSGEVPEKLSDTVINTNQFIAGTTMSISGFDLNYKYTHSNSDGSNGTTDGGTSFSQSDYRSNEHEVIFSKTIDNFTPYIKYTYLNTNADSISINTSPSFALENDSIWTLGLSYNF
ncbi:hypothetical protein [Vibrio neonatus]|uniref:hypothetical protein n=1 Tax=Vibrio neonatus TaxID=278860 RepID=UPI0021C3507F|nr:hypothetical protein [Vibrio neonatus]